jgi:hypothetical protein
MTNDDVSIKTHVTAILDLDLDETYANNSSSQIVTMADEEIDFTRSTLLEGAKVREE